MESVNLWKIIHSNFDDNPQSLVTHHIESYNDFFKHGIHQIFKEKNPISISSKYDEKKKEYKHQCNLYFGGKDGSKIYYGKPVIYDDNNAHYMFPNEARMRNMTYGMTVHYDVDVEFISILEPGEKPTEITADMMHEIVTKDAELNEIDYTAETRDYVNSQLGNFKKKTGENMEEILKDLDENDKADQEGGAPKKTVKLTTGDAAKLRETNEQTLENPAIQKYNFTLDKIYLGKFPIMLQSNFCILNGVSREVRYNMGECKNDLGGYFIIDGKEKTVVPQEKFADNMLYIRHVNDEKYLYSAEIRSVSENVSKPIRTLSVKIATPTERYSFRNIVVNIPNVRKPVPLFVVFRALGILSDKEIITMCLLDLEKYESMVDLFAPSVHDSAGILTQQAALMYIASFTKINTVTYVLEVLSDYFLPHVGEINYIQKAYYLGYIVFRLLSVYTGLDQPTDRDNFKYKRIELVGSLLYDLFREYYTIQQRQIHLDFEKKLYFNKSIYEENLLALVHQNYREIFKERLLETGFRKAFKGNWGSQTHTKRVGIVQDLNRLSFNSMLSHLRKTNLPLDSGVKLVGPRLLHNSQWGFIDPIDTPDGGNIGLHKHLAISTQISQGMSREPLIQWLREKTGMKLVEECSPLVLSKMTRVIVNGLWAGSVDHPIETIKTIKLYRRNALLPIYLSATFTIRENTIYIYSDAGRLCRPIFYYDSETKGFSYENKDVLKKIMDDEFSWNDLITGFTKKKDEHFKPSSPKIYEIEDLYEGVEPNAIPTRYKRFIDEKAIIDYIDPSESEDALIAVNSADVEKDIRRKYTHIEIHESLGYGMMCNLIIFPENNPPTRNSFSCGQSKQACSLYHTNHQLRMDKTAVVLNSGQIPIVKSRYLQHINNEENPYGENAIVAIMCYTGYNVEDAILVNEGALKRGLFRTTYYTTYEAHEESSKNANTIVDKKFTNIENEMSVVGTKPGYDYSKLDNFGIIRENTEVNDKTVLIGLTSNSVLNRDARIDMSKTPKKGQLGIVDKTFITQGEEGERIAKVRIREERIPNLGDKMASRAGQKGTIGLVIPECDMPFTKDGIRPDLIINPHAIPSRMTIGQLVECIIGKASVIYGGFSDCTAFNNKGSKIGIYGELLTKAGFHSSGNDILYNGMTGEQIETEIFMGPTYYMRLKHMVKDKINYRALGPRTALTHQPVSGRANDGGLRIGEMERDVLISHGATNFLKESMMDRGDKYYMAVCNTTGMIAIYNPAKNLFMSPMADGPIQFTGSLDGKIMNIENITKFGRSFSLVAVPYSMKLLIQELQTANIQMRIITEDNIDQIENMSYSKNMGKLLQNPDAAPEDAMIKIRNILKQPSHETGTPLSVASATIEDAKQVFDSYSPDYAPYSPAYDPSSPPYAPGSPAYDPNYNPNNSPPYAVGSPAYDPGSPEFDPNYNPNSPPYNPNSPPYNPNSPPYNPNSPPYNPNPNAISPPFASDSPNDVKIGGGERGFKNGEPVLLRGGKKTNRIWRIRNQNGKYITIETDDMEGIKNMEDSIQVVTPMDIYRPGEIVMHDQFMPHMNQQPVYESNPFDTPIMTDPTKIHFAPVIKIVNGPDNSVETAPATNESDVPSIPNFSFKPSVVTNESKKEEPSGESSMPIDFNKPLIITKKG